MPPAVTVAIVVFPLLQCPPAVVSVKVIVKPTQTLSLPVIGTGLGSTVTVLVA
jgi:hypothetical protein